MVYNIVENTNENYWDILLDDIDNSFFSRDFFLKPLKIDYKKYIILEKDIVKGCFCILLNSSLTNIINNNDYVIHSGLYIYEKNLKKNLGSKNNEIVKITSEFLDFITSNYNKINIDLNFTIKDIRPFLWYNYFESEDKKFKIDVKYTTILNLKLLDNSDDLKSKLFLNLSELRRRNIKLSRKKNINFSKKINVDSLVDAHTQHLKNQNHILSKKQKSQMHNLIETLINENKAVIQGTFVEKNLKYLVCYAYDNKSAYFLFGAPVGINNLNFLGTASHFNMFNYLKKKNIKRINLEGVNSPQRGGFKLSFGGDLFNYYTLKFN